MSLVAVAVLLAAEYFVTGETFDLGAVFIPPDGAWGRCAVEVPKILRMIL